VGQLLGSDELTVPVQDTYELNRAVEGLQALGATHTRGKLAISIG